MPPVLCCGLLSLTFACAGGDVVGEGEGEGEGEDLCESGCVLTLDAECAEGPASQEECVADCNALRSGECSVEYEALLQCGESSEVACDENDIPSVIDCPNEEGVFRDCIGG